MNARELINPAHFFVEISHDSFKAFNGSAAVKFPLERLADGRLTESCKISLTAQLQKFINRKPWQPRARVYCAIGARGVSLRRLNVPAGSKEELMRLLPLQIETEFPLPPEQLAWGYQVGGLSQPNSAGAKQELLLAAVEKDSLEEFSNIIWTCGATPIFTLAALTRTYVCPQPPGAYAVLGIERNYSELITIEGGLPIAVRVLSLGHESPAGPQGNGRDEPVGRFAHASSEISFGGSGPPPGAVAFPDALGPLVQLINGQALGGKLFVIGNADHRAEYDFNAELAHRLGNAVECQAVELALGESGSAAILGLQRALEREPGRPSLVLQVKQTNGKVQINRLAQLKWAAIALGLALLAILLPYAEALTLKSHLANKLAAIKTDLGRLTIIDRELDFLEYLQQNEPPYVDALLVLAKAAPPGTHFDSISMNRRGDVSLRGSLQNGQQVAELRSKLIDSGFFSSVSIEEQSPAPDRQKVTIRLSARWKPNGARTIPSAEPRTTSEPRKGPNQAGPGAPPSQANPVPPARVPVPKAVKN